MCFTCKLVGVLPLQIISLKCHHLNIKTQSIFLWVLVFILKKQKMCQIIAAFFCLVGSMSECIVIMNLPVSHFNMFLLYRITKVSYNLLVLFLIYYFFFAINFPYPTCDLFCSNGYIILIFYCYISIKKMPLNIMKKH